MISTFVSRACTVIAGAFFVTLAMAGGGHDHGDAKPAVAGTAPTRFLAQSEVFEAVGVLLSDEFSVLIDRTASNEPVLNATVELSSGSIKLIGQFHADHGDYSFDAKPFAKAGEYPITLTIKAGTDNDLLAGYLSVPATATAPSGADAHAHAHGWPKAALWGGVGLVVAALLLFVVRRIVVGRGTPRSKLGAAV
jgi:hypothetical protein